MAGQTIEELELKFWMLWTLSAAAVKTIFSSFYGNKDGSLWKEKVCFDFDLWNLWLCMCVIFILIRIDESRNTEMQWLDWGRLSLNTQNTN